MSRILSTAYRISEILMLRLVPGAINFFTLILISRWLGGDNFGLYSTAVATALAVGGIAFGPVYFGVLGKYAQLESEGRGNEYISALFSIALVIALLLVSLGWGSQLIGLDLWHVTVIAALFGLQTLLQEFLRARLHIWLYGFSALTRSVAFLAGSAYFIPNASDDLHVALSVFAASYLFGVGSAFLLCGSPLPALRLNSSVLRQSFSIGTSLTVRYAAESVLILGVRYVVLSTGSPQALSVFSFCVDLAQRSIGFFLNAASFIFVPKAFSDLAKGEESAFRSELLLGLVVSAAMASTMIVLMIGADFNPWFPHPFGALFDPLIFTIVCAGIALDRTVKMVFIPFAMRFNRSHFIAASFLAGAITAIPLAAASPALAFCAGYLVAAILCYLAVRNELRQ